MAVKLSLLICVLWWGLFSIPMFRNVEQKHGCDIPQGNLVRNTFNELFTTARKILKFKPMLFFMIAYFLYIDGVNTVINMSTSYGATLGLDSTGLIIALLVTQLVAFPCAILFGRISEKIGSLKMLLAAICMYLLICILGFIMGFGLEEAFLTIPQATTLFFALAILVGTVQGGIQAISQIGRAHV